MEYFSELQLKKVLMAILVVCLITVTMFGIVSIFGGHNRSSSYVADPSITVTGTGKVTMKPDVARMSFTVEQESKTMADAQKIVTDKANALISTLGDLGIDEKDIKTENYSAYPKYEYRAAAMMCSPTYCPPSTGGNQELTGYVVSHSISVKIRNIEKLGDVTNALTAAKVSNISGPNFEVDDMDKARADARSLAIADARTKARSMARDLGVRLGRVTGFYDNADGGVPMPMYADAESGMMNKRGLSVAASPVIPTGENSITSNVSVTFSIK